jgi:hypothetical protein
MVSYNLKKIIIQKFQKKIQNISSFQIISKKNSKVFKKTHNFPKNPKYFKFPKNSKKNPKESHLHYGMVVIMLLLYSWVWIFHTCGS